MFGEKRKKILSVSPESTAVLCYLLAKSKLRCKDYAAAAGPAACGIAQLVQEGYMARQRTVLYRNGTTGWHYIRLATPPRAKTGSRENMPRDRRTNADRRSHRLVENPACPRTLGWTTGWSALSTTAFLLTAGFLRSSLAPRPPRIRMVRELESLLPPPLRQGTVDTTVEKEEQSPHNRRGRFNATCMYSEGPPSPESPPGSEQLCLQLPASPSLCSLRF